MRGNIKAVQVASLVLCYSRMIFIQAYACFRRFECQPFLTASLRYFGCTAGRCMIDNTHVVVLKGTGKKMVPVPEMAAFAERLGFTFAAHEKGDSTPTATPCPISQGTVSARPAGLRCGRQRGTNKETAMCSCDHLPSVQQLTMSSDRAVLALLDLSLELTARSLRAEHPSLEDQAHRGTSAEPPLTHEALAASIVILSTTLREVIAGYRESLDYIFGDREEDEPDMPF